MAEIVNLRLARKRKARAEHDAAATENRALHGRTKAKKQVEKAGRERQATALDGHRLVPTKPDA